MKKVIIGIGIPASGKTTVLRAFADKNGYAYICPDVMREELTGNAGDQSRNQEVWDKAYEQASELLANNENVVFDATFADMDERKKFIEFAKENGAEKVEGIFVDTPIETAKERNAARERKVPEGVIDNFHERLEENPPSVWDGLDSLFVLDENQELVRAEKWGKHGVVEKEFGREKSNGIH